ncbi:hypothetical protein BDR22DRAFT_860406 [Usnea florida]
MNTMMTPSTQLNNGEDEMMDNKGEQWTEYSCSEKTLVEECRGRGDDDDIYQHGTKYHCEQSIKASCSEWVYGDHSRQGTDDDEYKNGWGDNYDTEPEQSKADGGLARTDSEDENADDIWEYSTEESVSETTDNNQTCEEHVNEGQPEDLSEKWKDFNDSVWSTGTGDWNESSAILPGDPDYVDPSKSSENEEDRVKSAAEIKYEELPFIRKHYFLNRALHILEAICLRTGRQRFRKYLEDPVWKRLNLVINPWSDDPDIRRAYGDWLTEDGVEAEWWAWFYGERAPDMPRSSQTAHILNSIYYLRNAALHRGDEGGLDFKQWELAMQVPELLGDAVGQKEMADLAEYVLGDGTMDEDVRADVERKMYTPRLSATKYQLLERIQTLLEESCFSLALRKIPDVLAMKGWDCAEKVELRKWIDIFKYTEVVTDSEKLASDLFPRRDSAFRAENIVDRLHYARMYIRNTAAHRQPVSEEQLVDRIHAAIRTAVLLCDWPRAIEIEIASEMWLTLTSRQEVLERLAGSYRNGKAETEYERRRRDELKLFLRNQQGKEEEEDEGAQMISAECDAKEEMVQRVCTRSTWSPSMHECLQVVKVVEGVNCIEEVIEEEAEKLVSNTWGFGEDSDDTSWGTPLEETGGQLC